MRSAGWTGAQRRIANVVTMRRHHQLLRALCLPAVAAVVVAGCAPGLAANPRFATDSGAGPQGAPEAAPAVAAPPAVEAPKNDLPWRDCTARLFSQATIPAIPGVTLECADFDADLDSISGASGSLSIGVVRARSAATPANAGPLVMTTGTDLPSSMQLPVWLSRSGADVLKTNPVVSIDRRGMGMSGNLDCRDLFSRQEMLDQAQFASGNDPVANLTSIVQTATTACTDSIAPGDSAYDNAHAAEDIERLRSTWDVPTLALLGVGNGAQVALAYAGAHPNKLSRLVLDSPLPLGIAAEARAEQKVKGQQAALDAFAAQCIAAACALGPDPKGAIDAMLTDARQGIGPGGFSVATLTDAISTALAFPKGDFLASTNALAGTLAAARAGDVAGLTGLVNDAETLRETDGQFVNGCSDALNRPTPDRVRELVVSWAKLYPQFGTVGALDLVNCLAWPSGSTPPDPKNLKIAVLLLGVQNDAVVGNEGVAAVAATVINSGAANRRVMWQGVGHGASIYSSCAIPPVLSYLASGKVPGTDTYCPA